MDSEEEDERRHNCQVSLGDDYNHLTSPQLSTLQHSESQTVKQQENHMPAPPLRDLPT